MGKPFGSEITLFIQDRWWQMPPLIVLLSSCMLPNYKIPLLSTKQILEDQWKQFSFLMLLVSFLLHDCFYKIKHAIVWGFGPSRKTQMPPDDDGNASFRWWSVVLPSDTIGWFCTASSRWLLYFIRLVVLLPSNANGQFWHASFGWSLCFIQIAVVLHSYGDPASFYCSMMA
jgi:hypothetical protein